MFICMIYNPQINIWMKNILLMLPFSAVGKTLPEPIAARLACSTMRLLRTFVIKEIPMTNFLCLSTYSWFDGMVKLFITSNMVRWGGGGRKNAFAIASVKLPKCWNAFLTSKYLKFVKFIFALGLCWWFWWWVPFCWEDCRHWAGQWILSSLTPFISRSRIEFLSNVTISKFPTRC